MSRIGESIPGISCIHDWQVIEGNNYRCKNCPATCKRDKGKLVLYSLGTKP